MNYFDVTRLFAPGRSPFEVYLSRIYFCLEIALVLNVGLFSFIFSLFNPTLQFFTINKSEKCPISIWRHDSNSQPSNYKSPPLATRPGHPPKNSISWFQIFCRFRHQKIMFLNFLFFGKSWWFPPQNSFITWSPGVAVWPDMRKFRHFG